MQDEVKIPAEAVEKGLYPIISFLKFALSDPSKTTSNQ
jgi:hypothetical protein